MVLAIEGRHDGAVVDSNNNSGGSVILYLVRYVRLDKKLVPRLMLFLYVMKIHFCKLRFHFCANLDPPL